MGHCEAQPKGADVCLAVTSARAASKQCHRGADRAGSRHRAGCGERFGARGTHSRGHLDHGLHGKVGDHFVRQHQTVDRARPKGQVQGVGAHARPALVRSARLRRLPHPALLGGDQRRREIDRGPPRPCEWTGVAPPCGLGDVPRAAPDLDDSAPAMTRPAMAVSSASP